MSHGEFGYVYLSVADAIERDIKSGHIPYGARLPNERELGEQYSVAPGTARRAVQELRDRGLAVTVPSKGSYITYRPEGETPEQDPPADH